MPTTSRRETENTGRLSSVDLKNWQRIQNLFAEIIGANISFFDSSCRLVSKPSENKCSCRDLSGPDGSASSTPSACVLEAAREGLKGHPAHSCAHRLHFFALPVKMGAKESGVLIVGPVLVGKREEESTYRRVCKELDIEYDNFEDRIREIRLFSRAAIDTVMDFLREIAEQFIKMTLQKQEFDGLLPGILGGSKETEKFFSFLQTESLANLLLNISMEVVKADSGSVLLLNRGDKSFYMKAAQGIRRDITERHAVPFNGSVAGYVAARRKPFLIQKEPHDSPLAKRLKRPEIRSSIVVPMTFHHRVLGVFCLNSENANPRFNQENLRLLDQLGKLASVAFARVEKA